MDGAVAVGGLVTWDAPGALELLLLSLAAFRTFKLLADDTILDRPRAWTVKRFGRGFEDFLSCPYCLGAHCALGWWLAWCAWPHGTLVVAGLFALSALVAVYAVAADRLAD